MQGREFANRGRAQLLAASTPQDYTEYLALAIAKYNSPPDKLYVFCYSSDMNEPLKTNKGFGVLFVLIALAIVAAIGLGGYYVWRTHQREQQPSVATQTAESQQTTATMQTTNGIFVHEWGIQIPVADAEDYEYHVADANTIDISSKTLRDAEAMIQCSPSTATVGDSEGHVGMIWRKPAVEPGPATYSPKVGNYYYAFVTGSQAICTDAPGYNMKYDVVNGVKMITLESVIAAMAHITAE